MALLFQIIITQSYLILAFLTIVYWGVRVCMWRKTYTESWVFLRAFMWHSCDGLNKFVSMYLSSFRIDYNEVHSNLPWFAKWLPVITWIFLYILFYLSFNARTYYEVKKTICRSWTLRHSWDTCIRREDKARAKMLI